MLDDIYSDGIVEVHQFMRIPLLIRRPDEICGIQIPVVRNLEETLEVAKYFESVLTAGPEAEEVALGHPNHRVWEFEDSESVFGPSRDQVAEMVAWGVGQPDLLVHCHAGMSRSTAAAWGVAMARGLGPEKSLRALLDSHPLDSDGRPRYFRPNTLLVRHLESVLGIQGLVRVRDDVLGSSDRFWY